MTARVCDRRRRLAQRHPELAQHLRATFSTGMTCRYQPAGDIFLDAVAVTRPTVIVLAMSSDQPEMDGLGQDAEFVDDAIDDDETSPEEQLLLDRKELSEAGLTLDNPEGFADD